MSDTIRAMGTIFSMVRAWRKSGVIKIAVAKATTIAPIRTVARAPRMTPEKARKYDTRLAINVRPIPQDFVATWLESSDQHLRALVSMQKQLQQYLDENHLVNRVGCE